MKKTKTKKAVESSAPESGSVSDKRWRIKRWVLEECEEIAPDRATALAQSDAEADPLRVTVTRQTCVEVK